MRKMVRLSGVLAVVAVALGAPGGEAWAAGPAALQTSPPDSSSLRSEVEAELFQYTFRAQRERLSQGVSVDGMDFHTPSYRELRGELIELLDRVAAELPGDDFVVGHRVGAWLIEGPEEAALKAARECEGRRWWCLELEATVLHHMGEVEAADSVFGESLSSMSPETRCERESVADLLDREALQQYNLRSCAGRRPINDRFWWLAEPLYILPGHDRRTEHRARFVSREWNQTFQAPIWDGLRPLSDDEGCYGGPGIQLEAMPGGRDEDGFVVETSAHRSEMRAARQFPRWAMRLGHATPWNHTTSGGNCILFGQGYSFSRPWGMLEDPLKADPKLWTLDRQAVQGVRRLSPDPDPPELYDPPYGPMSALDQQVGFFRRGDSVLVAAATSLTGTPLAAAGEATVGVVLARDEHDEPVMVLDEGAATEGTHRFAVRVPEARYLVSVEAVTDDAGAGRARFGAGLPGEGEGGLALSDILLFQWTEEAPEESLDAVQPRMLPTTRLEEGAEVGLYWEVYGADGDEPLTVAVRTRPEDPGLLRRIGRALRLTRGDDGVQVSWEDAADAGPHTSRTLRVDLGGLPEGPHTLEVTVETADGRATATREIVIGEG